MRKLWNTLLVIMAVAIGALTTAAQGDSLVEIENNSEERRKICIYQGKIAIIPKKCFEMNADEKVTWNREGDRSGFTVEVLRSRPFIDKRLYSRDLPGDTKRIIIYKYLRLEHSSEEAKPATLRYRLKVCNQQYDAKVFFTLAFETDKGRFTQGWWSVEQGECEEFRVSDLLKNELAFDYGNIPRTYFYARTYGSDALAWQGGDEGRMICVNESKAFKQFRKLLSVSNGTYDPKCDGGNNSIVSFRRLEGPKANEEYYYLAF